MAFQVSKTRHNSRTKHYFANPWIKIHDYIKLLKPRRGIVNTVDWQQTNSHSLLTPGTDTPPTSASLSCTSTADSSFLYGTSLEGWSSVHSSPSGWAAPGLRTSLQMSPASLEGEGGSLNNKLCPIDIYILLTVPSIVDQQLLKLEKFC